MNKNLIEVKSQEEEWIRKTLKKRNDSEVKRLIRFLDYPDLSRDSGSPLFELVKRIREIKHFSDFDEIKVPEIVRADISFDLFNFPADHPARNRSDTYYVDDNHILRTHTTVMWYYYLNQESVKEKIKNKLPIGSLCYGKVYRKDEIDRNHMNIFHQIDGWYLSPKSKEIITIDDLKTVLTEIAQEVLGSGIVHPAVLKNLGINTDEYNGWAFGFGLERLAITSMSLQDIRLFWSDDPRI